MLKQIKTILLISFTAFVLVSCGGSSSTSSTGSGSADGSVVFSGAGAADVLSGTTYTPPTGTITSGAHPVLPNTTFFTAIWNIVGAQPNDGTSITYTETISATSTSYVVSVSSGEHTPVLNFNNWSQFNPSSQVTGVTIDKAAKKITFDNVTLPGVSGTTTSLTLNGSLTAQ